MSADRFLDDLARTLAEPMPRRRAVRIIGASLAMAAVPGIRPGGASAKTESHAAACSNGTGSNPYQNVCDKILPDRTVETYCCGPPKWRFGCYAPDKGLCTDSCPPKVKLVHGTFEQYPCTATAPDAQGIIRGQCCVKPESKGCSPEGECLPNCPYQYRFGGAAGPVSCGKTCCATHQVCVHGECQPCEKYGGHTCQPSKGLARCCKKGTSCCFNETTTACCGPTQTCRAQNVKRATCVCDKGEKCGTDCCIKKDGESCCSGPDKSACCKKGECCYGECCTGKAVCCDLGCCDRAQGEYCLKKGANEVCKKGCAPANKAGGYCCGSGWKPNGSKTKCVKA